MFPHTAHKNSLARIQRQRNSSMANRCISTDIWNDEFIADKKPVDRLLYVYLLTNARTHICGFYKLLPPTICAETGLKRNQLAEAMTRLAPKILYIDGWVCIKNYSRYQSGGGEKIISAIENELKKVPKEILDRVSMGYGGGIDTSIAKANTNVHTKNPEERPEKSISFLTNMPSQDLHELSQQFRISEKGIKATANIAADWCRSKGKVQKDYKAFLRNWIRKDDIKIREQYSLPAAPKPVQEEKGIPIPEHVSRGIRALVKGKTI